MALVAFLYDIKLNYLKISQFIDKNTINNTKNNEIVIFPLDKKSEKN